MKWIYSALIVVFIGAIFIIYSPSMQGSFIWDDDAYITGNPLITAKDGFSRIWFSLDHPSQYFPMTYTVFKIEYKLWDFNPFGYHLVNLLIHIANAFLVWLVLAKLKIPLGWLAAIIFAIHPINVESVAWITELKNILMIFFYLLSLLFWLRFIEQSEIKPKNWLPYIASLILFAFSLFSKTTACTLPMAMAIILWLKHIPIHKKQWLSIIPYIIFGIMMGFLTIWWEQVRGSSANVLKLNYIERVLVAGKALCFYIEKMILPINLTFSYPLWNIIWTKPSHYLWTIAFSCITFLMWYFRGKIGKGPAAAIFFYVLTLAPVLGFVSIYTFYYSYVADHYVYAACIGPFALFAAFISKIWQKSKAAVQKIITVCTAIILILLCVQTWRQSHIYKNLETLWQDTLRKNPDSLLAHANIGTIYENRGNTEEALKHYTRAIEIYPDDEVMYYNIGSILKSQGKLDEAIACYRKAIQIRPSYSTAHNNLANTLKMQGKLDEAIEHYKMAILLQPKDYKAYYNLANTFRSQGQTEQAITLYRKAIEIEPSFNDARTNLAVTLESNGKFNETIEQYHKMLVYDSNSLAALNALASLLSESSDPNVRDPNKAVKYAEKAAELTGYNNPAVLKTLVNAYAAADRKQDAITAAQIAIDMAIASDNKELADSIRQWIKDYNQPN